MPALRRLKSFFKPPKPSSVGAPPPLPTISSFQAAPPVEPLPQFPQLHQPPHQQRPQRKSIIPVEPPQRITAEMIRELRELIRYRYALDIEIWRQRNIKEFKRDKLKENMRRSDAALVAIKDTLLAWDRREYFESDDEHKKFTDIRNRLTGGVKAHWTKNPPWEFVNPGGDPYFGPYEKYGRPVANRTIPTNGAQQPPQRPVNGAQQLASRVQRPVKGYQAPDNRVQLPTNEYNPLGGQGRRSASGGQQSEPGHQWPTYQSRSPLPMERATTSY